MNRRVIVCYAIAAGLTAGLVAPAAAADPSDPAAQPSADFKKLDTNKDGYLSRQETQKIKGFDKAFTEADENRDGRLDANEFAKAQSLHDRIRAGQYIDDSVITARVKAALIRDVSINALSVSVETHKGIVLLSGFVDSENQARRAAEIASAVEGVVNVKSSLTVKS